MKKKTANNLKNKITYDRIVQTLSAIPAIYWIFGGSGFFGIILIAFRAVRNYLWILLKNIYQLKVWSIPVILKVWQLLLLIILIFPLYKLLSKYFLKLNQEKHFIYSPNYKWKWAKDHLNRIEIYNIPYCKKCNKKYNYTYSYHMKCPVCENKTDYDQSLVNEFIATKKELFEIYPKYEIYGKPVGS